MAPAERLAGLSRVGGDGALSRPGLCRGPRKTKRHCYSKPRTSLKRTGNQNANAVIVEQRERVEQLEADVERLRDALDCAVLATKEQGK